MFIFKMLGASGFLCRGEMKFGCQPNRTVSVVPASSGWGVEDEYFVVVVVVEMGL